MTRIALDPTPYFSRTDFLGLFDEAARAGYEWIHLTPHPDFIPFFSHPRADRSSLERIRARAQQSGVGIAGLLPVQRWSAPDELPREAAVRNFRRIIQIAVDLDVRVINTEFSGRPERAEESEAGFYRSLEELLPVIESEDITVNIDPHPDDFVEDGLTAVDMVRGIDSPLVSFLYCAPHTFHQGGNLTEIMEYAGDLLTQVHVADSFDHRASSGNRYIVNPPGAAARIHQHLDIGQGEVDWDEFFGTLAHIGFDGIATVCVFAWEERARESSAANLARVQEYVAKYF